VLNARGMSDRWTFYIDKDGVIKEIDKKITTAKAGEDVAAKVKTLGIGK
jgi:peroxiredoxin Q/BCP